MPVAPAAAVTPACSPRPAPLLPAAGGRKALAVAVVLVTAAAGQRGARRQGVGARAGLALLLRAHCTRPLSTAAAKAAARARLPGEALLAHVVKVALGQVVAAGAQGAAWLAPAGAPGGVAEEGWLWRCRGHRPDAQQQGGHGEGLGGSTGWMQDVGASKCLHLSA